jgi:hypothetical protein
MAALQALTGGLVPKNEDTEFLEQVGIIPTTSSSTTTTPYTAAAVEGGAPPENKGDTAHPAILQAIQQLQTSVTNGFAQVMAKLSNRPAAMNGGAEISNQHSEMQSENTVKEPSFFNKLAKGAKNIVKNTANAVGATGQGASNVGPQAEPTWSASGGRRRKSRRSKRKGRKASRRRN